MARPSYLCRREGGRYFLQLRVGNPHAELYGRKILRASLRTADFGEARRRLVDNLGWANELVAAPDLEAAGSIIHKRLTAYTAVGAPQSERALAERLAFEHQARHYMARANERGYAFSARFERFATNWVDFVNQNKAAEDELGRQDRQEQYERGRAEATNAVAKGWLNAPPPANALPVVATAPATAPITLSDAVHQTIDALVKAEVAKQVSKPPAPTGAAVGGQPADPPAAPEGLRLSQARALYLAPPGKKRMHKTKGRADTAAVVQFAVDFFSDPVFDSITTADWDRLDEALI